MHVCGVTNVPAEELISRRQRALLTHIRCHGRGQVDSLADRFQVTPQTIRRDLNLLCNLKLLQRVHGGAVVLHGPTRPGREQANLDYLTRLHINPDGKNHIGRLTAKIIPNDASIFINIGTTTECVASHLTRHIGLLAITNNINIANTLRRSEAIRVMTAGGLVRHEDGGIVGDATEEFMDRFKVDYAIMGCSALDEDGTILEFDVREIRVAQSIIRNARSVILVADNTKFQRKAPVRLGSLGQVDFLVSDRPVPEPVSDYCQANSVQIITEDSFQTD